MDPRRPVAESDRIQSLDVLRGFALLGILLLNIIGFALPYASYSNPSVDLGIGSRLDLATWAGVELFAEGAMRALFSMLFGAGVVLFATGARAKSGWLHYKRTFWLLIFGLFDAFILLWAGDILVTYALAGALLYWVRNWRARYLLVLAAILLVLMSGLHLLMAVGLGYARDAAVQIESADTGTRDTVEAAPTQSGPDPAEMAAQWEDFAADFAPTPDAIERELEQRRASYPSAFEWNRKKAQDMMLFVIPVFMLWDSLAMMLIGMVLFKLGVLQGRAKPRTYRNLLLIGFAVGLAVNGYEVARASGSGFDVFSTFAQMQPTYHFGRLAMGLGWIGLVVLALQRLAGSRLHRMLAAVGRMALTNYLMHSLIALFLFTGAGIGLVGRLGRFELLLVVFAIWALQLVLSDWWMQRYLYGPLEWLWRLLTYGRRPAFRRAPNAHSGTTASGT